jgi:DNA gyrase subunit A
LVQPHPLLSVSENGYGKRTDVDQCRPVPWRQGRHQHEGHPQGRKVTGIDLFGETSELMVISQFGKIIRIDTKSIRAAVRLEDDQIFGSN